MIQGNLLESVKITHLTADGTNYPLAAGTTDADSGYIDMAGFDGVLFVGVLGDNADTATLTVAVHGSDASGSGYAALTGANISFTMDATNHDNKVFAIDVKDPRNRYLRLNFDRGVANSALQSLVAIQYDSKAFPVTQPTGAGQFPSASAALCVQNL